MLYGTVKKKRPAVSGVIALTVVTLIVAFGIVASYYFPNSFNPFNIAKKESTVSFQVVSASLTQSNSGMNYLSITIQNTGNVPITSVSLNFNGEKLRFDNTFQSPIMPGQSWTGLISGGMIGRTIPTVGFFYPYSITVTGADGTSSTFTSTILCNLA
jgi:hypothetical protein